MRNLIVAQVVAESLEAMKLKRPPAAEDVEWDHLKIE